MKNLKRALSFALASVMVIGMMVVGAGAADFTDADAIVNDDAVNTLYALNVINGKGDGSYFDPTATLTRAEAAKLIVYILHGGKAPVIGTKAIPTYSDIKGTWAESFIEYCSSVGIIAGYEGKFNPAGTLTGSALAKMLLVAMNYDANVFGLVGDDWEINTNVEANKAGLYEDLETVDPSAPISRDNAAQMIYNAIMANTMYKTWGQNMATGEISQNYSATGASLYASKFDGEAVEGVMTFDADVDYNADNGKFTYHLTADWDHNANTPATAGTVTVKADYTDLFMKNVKVLYKTNSDNTKTVYGIYEKGNNTVATGLVGQLALVAGDNYKVKVGTVTYKLDAANSSTNIYNFLDTTSAVDTLNDLTTYKATQNATVLAYEVELIDNDADGKVNVIVAHPFNVEKVSYVGTKSFTTIAVLNGAEGTKKFADVVTYEGIAQDDYVKVTPAAYTPDYTSVYEKLELVEDTAAAVKTTDGKILFDGTWYNTAMTGTSNAEAGAKSKYVAVNDYLFYLTANNTKANVKDFAIVVARADNAAGIKNTFTTQLLKADGTKVVVEATTQGTVGYMYKLSENTDGNTVLTSVNATNVTTSNTNVDYVFVPATGDAQMGNNLGTVAFTNASGNDKGYFVENTTNNYYVNDDAVVFVWDSVADKYSVTTGAVLKETGTSVAKTAFMLADANDATGFNNVVAAYIQTASALATNKIPYGYVVDDVVKYEDGEGKYFTEVKFWNGSEVVTLKTKTVTGDTGVMATAYGLTKGDLFTYELNADGKIETMTIYAAEEMTDGATTAGKIEIGAVTGYVDNMVKVNSDYFTAADGTETSTNVTEDLKITKDTVIIYVDQADKAGAEGGSIQMAQSNVIGGNTANFANVKFIANSSDEIILLVVDVNNDMLGVQ